ncbi:Ni/Fe-hydrogenase, b-type cytochrome subunit [Thermincola ferriacetica]
MQPLILVHTRTARFLHWFNMLCITVLILTGFYIHSPLRFNIFPNMDVARKLHFIFMYLVIYGVIIRLYYSFYSGDYKEIMFTPGDIKGFPALAKYYLFLSKESPNFGKYNPGQKLVYSSWVILSGVQALTGFILYFSGLAWLGNLLGGIVTMRQVHYLVTWIFVSTVGIHVYLSFVGGKHVLKSIITGCMPAGANLQPASLEQEEVSF